MRNVVWIVSGLVVLAGLLWAGFALAHHMECQGLEEDYLNAFSEVRATATLRSFTTEKADAAAANLIEQAEKRALLAMEQIHNRCGMRAAQTAARKAI